jgi:hypothetical protein
MRTVPGKLFTDAQLQQKDINTLKRYLRYKLGGYRVAFASIRAGNLLYRAVRWNRRPSKVDDVSYPPPANVTKLGRVNREGFPVFYASCAGPGAFYELRAEKSDLIALSEWEVTEPLWMHNLGFHPDALRRMGVSDVLLRSRWHDPIPNERKRNAKLRRQLSLAFTENIRDGEEYRYKQSIVIAELLFDKAEPILTQYPDEPRHSRAAGIVYPAVQMKAAADNVAIFPEFVDSSLQIRSVRYVLVEAADEARSSYSLRTLAISRRFSGRDIIWQDNLLSDDMCRSSIALEGTNWVLRDGSNRIYAHRTS